MNSLFRKYENNTFFNIQRNRYNKFCKLQTVIYRGGSGLRMSKRSEL